MQVRFQADADLDARIIRGLKRRQPGVDFQTAPEAGLQELTGPEVLTVAANSSRILVTHDRRTMPGHFAEFIKSRNSPGVIGIAVQELSLIWVASQAEEWPNRLVWVPL